MVDLCAQAHRPNGPVCTSAPAKCACRARWPSVLVYLCTGHVYLCTGGVYLRANGVYLCSGHVYLCPGGVYPRLCVRCEAH